METYEGLIKALYWILLVIYVIAIIVEFILRAPLAALVLIFTAIIHLILYRIYIGFVSETVKLREDFNAHKTATEAELGKLRGKINSTDYSPKKHKNDDAKSKITTVLPATYVYEDGKRWINVEGKFTHDETVGVKCPLCNALTPASRCKCERCNLDFYFK